MPYTISLRLYWLLVVSISITIVLVLGDARGGVDIDRYWMQSPLISTQSSYYIKEIISWFIIKYTGLFSSRDSFLMILFGAMTLILCLSSFKLIPSFLVACVSPFGVLLFSNILRQGIACVFFAVAIEAIISKRYLKGAIFSLLSIFSHNTFIVFVLILIFSVVYHLSSNSLKIFISFFTIVIFIIFLYTLLIVFPFEREFTYTEDGIENYLNGFIATIVCLIWLKFCAGRERVIVASFLIANLLIYLFSYIFNIPGWVPGRFATSLAFFSLIFMYASFKDVRIALSASIAGALAGFLGIYIHQGAYSMLFES